ncbi:S26 family signal peptidase [Actinophytocola xinjiangensis]|uniref:S26 family signal peptidase n=1 Tax=Actinophytocola xinjiangensis TaxID=485602 RepID=UPI001FE4E281|nr:S26 family signal peptidase [Actinophytocola xinjiangensis]
MRGMSMEPAYREGDQVLVRRGRTLEQGQVVVLEQPSGTGWRLPPLRQGAGAAAIATRSWLIKRVIAVAGDPVPRDQVPLLATFPETRVPPGKIVLLGDNQAVSLDSRRLGYFPTDRVLGVVARDLPRRG